jgi:NosR/NirI family transcriptional regulator, nitrous oxide reductase regulator
MGKELQNTIFSTKRDFSTKVQIFIMVLVLSLFAYNSFAIQRFPKPEFEGNYKIPPTQVTKIQSPALQYLDIAVLIGAMSLITWMILKKRFRRGVFWISVFSLLYFGFYRKGCICPVGSLQNVTMAIFNPDYKIPFTAIAFFTIPLGFTLFFGRTFCAGVCPLGAIQDLFAMRPISLKPWIRYLLGLIPLIYLGLALLYAATGTDFIVCRYDPFVGLFRHNATYLMFLIGGVLLLTGIFIARPYCRFLCPYGVILNLVSRFSRKHVSIAPGKCINCKLCEHACPYDAIDKPTGLGVKNDNRELIKKLIIYCMITPLLVVVCGWTVSRYHQDFAVVNFKVRLAKELMANENKAGTALIPTEITTFKSSGKPLENLYKEANAIVHRFYVGSWIMGALIGLVFGLVLARLTIFKYRDEYLVNKGSCLSCARCLEYCPVEDTRGQILKESLIE